MKVQRNVALGPLTTFGVGGPAERFVTAKDLDELKQALQQARTNTWPVFVLGHGSNVVVSDSGVRGLVIRLALRGISHQRTKQGLEVSAAAGENWDDLVLHTVQKQWSGLENLSGIPGTVGGAVVQNVGAYGQELHHLVQSVDAISSADGSLKTFSVEECKFSYRNSFFKSLEPQTYIVTSVRLLLDTNGQPSVSYQDMRGGLARHFAGHDSVTLQEVREAVLEIRRSKGMVIEPNANNLKSVGSFFVNPVVSAQHFEKIKRVAGRDSAKMEALMPWFWPQSDGRVKISAAFLMEYTPYRRGFTKGRVGISPRHTLGIVNLGGARAAEIVDFAREIQTVVFDLFGVLLEPEAKLVGFEKYPLLEP
jgi:UDP-N-acetylmuramate dehydrogenase